MKTNKWIYLFAIASLMWVACDDDDDMDDRSLNDTDEVFVEKAARSNMAEIKFSEIAVTKATDSLVKVFAQEMIDEHTKAQNELQDIADDYNGIEWPNDLDQGHKAIRDRLDTMAAGFSFDTAFVGTQERLHLAARTIFHTATTTTTENRLRMYSSKYLPYIEEHLNQIDSLQMTLMPADTTSANADGN